MRARWLGSIAILVSASAGAAEDLGSEFLFATRLTGDALALRGEPAGLLPAGRVPNLLAPRVSGQGFTDWTLRGLGTGPGPSTLAPAVQLLVDEVPLGQGDGRDFALFDVLEVAVAAGGFGASGTGGAVAVTLAQPVPGTFSGWVGGGWGAYDRKLARGGVNVPLGALTLNASAYVSDDDGVARNRTTGEKLNDDDRAGLRLAARVDPAEALSLTVSVAHVEDKGENVLSFGCDPAAPTDCGGRTLTTGLTKARILGGGPQFGVPVAGDKARQRLGSLRATTLVTGKLAWEQGLFAADLLVSFRDGTEASGIDHADGRGLPTATLPNPPVRGFVDGGLTLLTDRRVQEARQQVRLAAALPWGGVQLLGVHSDSSDQLDIADLETREDGTAAGTQRLLADRVARTDTRRLEAQALADARLGPLRLEAGVGYVDEVQRLGLTEVACGPAGCLGGLLGATVPARQGWGTWTALASADLALGGWGRIFAGATRGYRPGGWNVRAVTPSAFTAFGPETAWTFEAGGAAELWGDRLRARLTLFAIRADDRQGSGSALLEGVPQLTAGRLGDWRNRGVELALEASPVEALALRLTFAAQDARWRADDGVRAQQAACAGGAADACGVGIVRADGTLATPVNAPDFSVGAGAGWTIPVPVSGIVVTPGFDLLWASRTEIDTANLVAGPGGRLTLDAVVAIETDDRAWLLTLACRNCTDSDAAEASLFGWGYLAQPRSWLVAARRRF